MSSNKVKLDLLTLDTHNVYTFGVIDLSFYPQGFSIVNPTIQITPPNFERIVLAFTAKNITVYNSNQLGLTSPLGDELVELPDGVWKLKYTITPANEHILEKSVLRTEKIQQKWGEAFISVDMDCNGRLKDKKKDELDDIWMLIQGAIADGNKCNDIEAMRKYKLAYRMLDNFKCK